MNEEKIRQAVMELVAQTKDYEPEDKIEAGDLLFYDHDFTSMDMLDLLFRIEQHFQIKIAEGTLYNMARGDTPEEEFSLDGYLTDQGRKQLMELLSDSPENIFPERIHKSTLPMFSTVNAMVRLVSHLLAKKDV